MKKLKLSMIFAAVALLVMSCSNLWDYDPPKTNTPPPITNNDPPLKELKYWVDDGTGTPKEVTVKTTGDKATLQEIKDAYGKQHGTPTPPAGFDNPEWLDSDLNTPAKGSYPPGSELFIGFNPIKTGYTAAVTLAGAEGGKREFITNDAWDGPQTLSDILTEAGITDPSNPGTPPTDWTFKGWAEADKYPIIIDPGTYPSTTYQSGTTFVAVYEVPYKINIGGTDYTVTVPVTAPNEGATWEQIKAAAKADSGILSNSLVSGDPAKLDSLLWSDGEGAPSKTGGKQYPANAEFTQQVEFKYSITDANGKTVEVNFGAKPSNTVITLDQIIAKAKENDTSADFGKGRDGNENIEIKTWNVPTSGAVPPGEVKPTEKELTYYVNKNNLSVEEKRTVTDPTVNKMTPNEIFGGSATTPTSGPAKAPYFGGWLVTRPDGTSVTYPTNDDFNNATELFPAGTKVEPISTYGTGGALGNLILDNQSSPAIGDGVTDKDKIIPKIKIQNNEVTAEDGKVLGYVYAVDETAKVVYVVAKEVITTDPKNPTAGTEQQFKWGSSGAALNGYHSSTPGGVTVYLRDYLNAPDSGYNAWKIIRDWNPDALYQNYPAIKAALCYPKKSSDVSGNVKVDEIVLGQDVDNRWYLPSIAEFTKIQQNGTALLNWTATSHNGIGVTSLSEKTFWAVNVDESDADSNENGNQAQCVTLGDSFTISTFAKTNEYYVIPVRQFKYE